LDLRNLTVEVLRREALTKLLHNASSFRHGHGGDIQSGLSDIQHLLENVTAGPNADAALHQETPCLIDQAGAVVDQSLTKAMERLQVQLFF